MNEIEQFNAAVSILRHELSADSANVIRFSLEQNESFAHVPRRVAFGIAIRNFLVSNGILWEEAAVFSVWVEMLKESTTPSQDRIRVSGNRFGFMN
jgi:hypothetical protein